MTESDDLIGVDQGRSAWKTCCKQSPVSILPLKMPIKEINLFQSIPILLSVLFLVKVFLFNALAIHYGHTKPLFPYLSDSGATEPEAGFFSFFVSLEAILVFVLGWIRFKQIRYVCANYETNNNDRQFDSKPVLKHNKVCLYLFVVIMLSMTSVAAFRSTEHVYLHFMAAAVLFGAYVTTVCTLTWMSYKLVPTVNSLAMARFRLALCVVIVIADIIFTISGIASIFEAKAPFGKIMSPSRLWWDQSWGGYESHVVSTIAESIMILMASPYFASFVCEFGRIQLNKGKLTYKFIVQK